jgi:hypothetical protein
MAYLGEDGMKKVEAQTIGTLARGELTATLCWLTKEDVAFIMSALSIAGAHMRNTNQTDKGFRSLFVQFADELGLTTK